MPARQHEPVIFRGQAGRGHDFGNDKNRVVRNAIREAKLVARDLEVPCGLPGGPANTSAYGAALAKSRCNTQNPACQADPSSTSCQPVKTRYGNIKADDCDVKLEVTSTPNGSFYTANATCYATCLCSLTCTLQDEPGTQETELPDDI